LMMMMSVLLLWTVLLGPHQDLSLCDLLSTDGTSNFVEVLAPNILVQFLSLPYHDTSLHNSLSTCLRFVQLQSNLCHLLTGYIADVAETFKSLIWLSGRAAWNRSVMQPSVAPVTFLGQGPSLCSVLFFTRPLNKTSSASIIPAA